MLFGDSTKSCSYEIQGFLAALKKSAYLDPILSQLNTIYLQVISSGYPLKYKSLKLFLLLIFFGPNYVEFVIPCVLRVVPLPYILLIRLKSAK